MPAVHVDSGAYASLSLRVMIQPEIHRYTVNSETAGQYLEMQVLSGPKGFFTETYDEAYQHVWRNGLVEGEPGLVRQDALTAEQADDYMGYPIPAEQPRPDSPEHPSDSSDIGVFTVVDGTPQMTAFARAGMGMTPADLRSEHAQMPVFHVNNFEVAAHTLEGRPIDATERYAAGMVLAHSVALAAREQGFDKVSYKVERANRDRLYALAGRLGLGELEVLGYDPGIRNVKNRTLMSRTEVATSAAGLAIALPKAEGLSFLTSRTPLLPAANGAR